MPSINAPINDNLPALAKSAGIKALKAWNIQADNIELISQGENLVFQLETVEGERFALRIHRPGYHNMSELESEQVWTSALNKAGILVPIGQPKPDGSYYESVAVLSENDIRQVGLVAWLKGQSLHQLVTEQPDLDILLDSMHKTGTIAGLIHNQSSKWQIPTGFSRHHLDEKGFMGERPFWGPFWALPELSAEQKVLFVRTKEAIFDYLVQLDKSPTHYSMLHADLHGGNLLVSGDNITIIDFDDAGFGWHPYELAVALFHFQSHPQFAQIYQHHIKGYCSVRNLDQDQLDQIPVFLLIRALASIGWCHQRREFDRREYLASLIQLATTQCQLFLDGELLKMFNSAQ